MRILIVGINYAPELTGIGKYSSEMAEWLAAAGHEVRFVTAPPHYPEWRVADGYSAWRYAKEARSGVVIWRCPVWVPTRPSGLKRLLHLGSFALSCLPVMARQSIWRPNVVLAIAPPLFCAPAAWACARLSGAKAWLHIQDFEVDAAFELGILRARWLRTIVGKVECWIMRRFDRVSTISPNMLMRLPGKSVAAEDARLFTNWVDVDAIFPLREPSILRRELGVPLSDKVVLYSGSMGEKQGLEIVLESASRLIGEKDVRFILCGDGPARRRLQREYGGLSNVLWLPLQPLERLNELLNLADIHLLPQRPQAGDLVMPSKLTGMLASGRPVVASAHEGTQIAEVMRHCGIAVEPDNVERFSGAILQLARNNEECARLGAQAREHAVRDWSKGAVMRQFESQIKDF